MALIARHASGIKKDAATQASLGDSILFIPVLAYARHDLSDENNTLIFVRQSSGAQVKICLRPPENGRSSLPSKAGIILAAASCKLRREFDPQKQSPAFRCHYPVQKHPRRFAIFSAKRGRALGVAAARKWFPG